MQRVSKQRELVYTLLIVGPRCYLFKTSNNKSINVLVRHSLISRFNSTMAVIYYSLAVVVLLVQMILVNGLDNGLAKTPPMGWMAWERFRCNVDCKNDPENCISERLIKQIADHIESDGFKDAGYEYVCIDDCWSEMKRSEDERLVANVNRFPNGIRKLADYIHSKGLKFGLYADYGTKTCEGYPGSIKHIWKDAETLAEWGVDYLKLDGCYASPLAMDEGYPTFSWALNRTGRPMTFSCSWPAYQVYAKMEPDYAAIGKYCNLWRNYGDIQDSWTSLVNIIDWFGDNQNTLIKHAKPGQWNDPDELIIGNFGLSFEQARTQFAIWAILAAPLMMSNDLRNIDKKFQDILLNKEIIAVNQDLLGRQGRRVFQDKKANIEVWRRYLVDGSVAVVLLSKREDMPVDIKAPFWRIGIRSVRAHVRDLYAKQDLGHYERSFTAKVNPSGVVMVKITECCAGPYSADKGQPPQQQQPEQQQPEQQHPDKLSDNKTTTAHAHAADKRNYIAYRNRFFRKH